MLEIDALKKHIEVLNGQIRNLRKVNDSTGITGRQRESVKGVPKAPLLESQFKEHDNEYLPRLVEDYCRIEKRLHSLNATCERQNELITKLQDENKYLAKKKKELDNENKQLDNKNKELDNENNQLVYDCIKANEGIIVERSKNIKLKQEVGEDRGQDDDKNNSTEDGENSSQVRYHIVISQSKYVQRGNTRQII